MSRLRYALEKLSQVVSSLASGADKRSTLAEAGTPLDALTDLPLTDDSLEPVLTLIQSLGLVHRIYAVPVRLPVPVAALPDSRLRQIAEFAVTALVEIATQLGAAGPREILQGAIVAPTVARRLRYRHLGWEGHRDSGEYLAFLQRAFPTYPLDVLQQWFQRHGSQAMELHGQHVDLERLSFRQELWSTDQVAALSSRKLDWLEAGPNTFGGAWLYKPEAQRQRNWLVSEMAQSGTWPVAPIVLEDGALASNAPNAVPERPYLLEGHRRTALLLNLAASGKASERHPVWVASYLA